MHELGQVFGPHAPLPGGFRVYPQVGADVQLPINLIPNMGKYFKLEGGFTWFFSPRPGPDEILGYGDPTGTNGGATGVGFGFSGGLTGDLWGPLGYALRITHNRYNDQFFGEGKKWTTCDMTQCGGVATETYSR